MSKLALENQVSDLMDELQETLELKDLSMRQLQDVKETLLQCFESLGMDREVIEHSLA